MARINIDDSLFLDERMRYFIRKSGEEYALGSWIRVAKCAQKYWIEEELIPKNVWKISSFSEILIESGLVEERKNGFYLRGSEDQFSWLVAKKKNGLKGGRPRKNNDLTKATESYTKATESYTKATESYGNPLALALAPAPAPVNKIRNIGVCSAITYKLFDGLFDSTPEVYEELKKVPLHLQEKLVYDYGLDTIREKSIRFTEWKLSNKKNSARNLNLTIRNWLSRDGIVSKTEQEQHLKKISEANNA